jgi:signal transduction histidine kinase
MHDIVSHHITVIVAQASAAARVVGRGSTVAPEILDTIASSGREALGELRRLLGALRPESQLPGSLPWPQLDHVPALIHQMERSGLPVELIVRGQPRPLPVSVELNAYRIIQEALTNALKHAGPTRTEVELDYQPTQLALRVSDDGSSPVDAAPAVPTPSTSGFGVLGMIHRVSLLGGRISMGPVTGHGFQVSACIPVPKG